MKKFEASIQTERQRYLSITYITDFHCEVAVYLSSRISVIEQEPIKNDHQAIYHLEVSSGFIMKRS